nr:hypothetical protein [Tanacetum cinerariifolium]
TPKPRPPLPFSRLSPEALQKRRAEGLWFRCPEKFHPGHVCSPPQFLLIAGNENETDSDIIPDSGFFHIEVTSSEYHDPPLTTDPHTPHFLSISDAAYLGLKSPRAVRVTGHIQGQSVIILVDCGSTHNIIQPRITSLLSTTPTQIRPFPVMVGNGRIRGDIGINPFKNALRAHYLPHSSGKIGGLDQISNKDATILYCLANGVKVDYAKLIWEDIIHKLNKKIRGKVIPYPRFISLLLEYMMPEYDNEKLTINHTQVFSVHNWALKPNQTEGPPFTNHMKAICNLDVHVDFKAPKPSSQTKEVFEGKKPLKVDSEENNLQNTHMSPRVRHSNPKLANQKKKLSPVWPRTKAQAILYLPH